MSKELPIPDDAQLDNNAIELARIWAANGQQHVSIATGVWDNPAAWGSMLVDLAKHIAHSYSQSRGDDYSEALSLIKQGIDAEWESPTE